MAPLVLQTTEREVATHLLARSAAGEVAELAGLHRVAADHHPLEDVIATEAARFGEAIALVGLRAQRVLALDQALFEFQNAVANVGLTHGSLLGMSRLLLLTCRKLVPVLSAVQRSQHAVLDALGKLVGPVGHRLRRDADGHRSGREGSAEQFDRLGLEHVQH
jgi:hypothetical protein